MEPLTPPDGWAGEQRIPLSLSQVLQGQEILQAEHEVDSHWRGLLRLRLRGAKSPQLMIQPVEPEPGVPTPWSLAWALKFSLGKTPRIWRPNRVRIGDGPLAVRELQRSVGKRFAGVDFGARLAGLAVARLRFEDGDAAMVFPQPLPMALALSVSCVLVLRWVWLTPQRVADWTPGAALLE